jgi:leucyl aminopeptidase
LKEISSDIADVRNIGAGGPGGHITAALYLETFVKAGAEHGAASLSQLSTASAKKEKTEATGTATATGAGNNAAVGATASGSETGGGRDGGGRGGVGDGVISWVHLDFMGFNKRARHGRPKGGEAQGMRTLFDYLTSPSLRQ